MWQREKIASNVFGYGGLGLLAAVLRLRRVRPQFPADRDQAGQRADRRPHLPAGVLRLVLDPRRRAERSPDRGREGPIEKAESDRVWVWPDLVYTELISLDRLFGRPDRLVDLPQGAARAAGQPGQHAEPVEGAVVFPRAPGNARLLRSLAGGRGAAGADHRRADLHSVYRPQPQGERLLHLQRAQGGDRAVPVRLRGPVGRR